MIIVLLATLACVMPWPFASFLDTGLGPLGYAMVATGLFVVLLATYCGCTILRLLAGAWRMTLPGHALKVARACAREHGKETGFGSVSVYVFGPADPSPMLNGQLETCRCRFKSMAGEMVDFERPLRVFAFAQRDGFDAFFRRAFLFSGNLDGFYVPWSKPTIAITTEFAAYRLPDPARVARVLLSYFLLDSYKRCPSPLWIQMGVASFLACGGDREELSGLNRKMLAALGKRSDLGAADLFASQPRALVRLMRDWQNHDNFARCSQLIAQSWSVVEFLCGLAACEETRESFRAFLMEYRIGQPQEEVFKRHFGYGFGTLLEDWRAWVLENGAGTIEPPPPHIRDVLFERVIPTVKDPQSDSVARIEAIREMGRRGYVLGADALIKLLADDDEALIAEGVWSLEAISGLALDADPEKWTQWWDSLPHEARGLCRA
jgi:hypothetical protein